MNKSSKRNKKLCWNCEGEIDKDAIHCLFCGSELAQHKSKLSDEALEPPRAPYSAIKAPLQTESEQGEQGIVDSKESSQVVEAESREGQGATLSFILLLAGAVFFSFAFLLLFFSKNDTLVLSWDSTYWFIYLLVSLPLIFFGWKALKQSS